MPVDQLHVVTVAATERAVIVKDGRPLRILCEGEHLVWRVEGVVVETIDVSVVVCPPLRDARRELLVGNGSSRPSCPKAQFRIDTCGEAGGAAPSMVDGGGGTTLPQAGLTERQLDEYGFDRKR